MPISFFGFKRIIHDIYYKRESEPFSKENCEKLINYILDPSTSPKDFLSSIHSKQNDLELLAAVPETEGSIRVIRALLDKGVTPSPKVFYNAEHHNNAETISLLESYLGSKAIRLRYSYIFSPPTLTNNQLLFLLNNTGRLREDSENTYRSNNDYTRSLILNQSHKYVRYLEEIPKNQTLLAFYENILTPKRLGKNYLHALANIDSDPLNVQEEVQHFTDVVSRLSAVSSCSLDKQDYYVGAKSEARGDNTALHYAVSNAKPILVDSLLKHGASPNIKNKAGKTPIDMLVEGSPFHSKKEKKRSSHQEYMQRKLALRPRFTEEEFLELKNVFKGYGVDIDILYNLAKSHQKEVPEDIIFPIVTNHGSVLDNQDHYSGAKSKTRGGNTALHYAVSNAKLGLVDYLLKHGASIDIKNKAGKTPLDLLEEGHPWYGAEIERSEHQEYMHRQLAISPLFSVAEFDALRTIFNVHCITVATPPLSILNRLEVIDEKKSSSTICHAPATQLEQQLAASKALPPPSLERGNSF